MSRSFESNGPDVKIRGTAAHIAEKYVTLARDAASSGDRVAEQSYLQHAEHYFRIVAAAQAQMPQTQQMNNQRFDGDDDDDQGEQMNGTSESRPHVGLADPQPYINGDGAGEPNGHDGETVESEAGNGQSNNGGNGGGRSRNRRPPRERAPRPEAVGAEDDPAATPTDD